MLESKEATESENPEFAFICFLRAGKFVGALRYDQNTRFFLLNGTLFVIRHPEQNWRGEVEQVSPRVENSIAMVFLRFPFLPYVKVIRDTHRVDDAARHDDKY